MIFTKYKYNAKKSLQKIFYFFIIVSFIISQFYSIMASPSDVYAQSVLDLPVPGAMVRISQAFSPPLLKGMKIEEHQPFEFDFIMDSGTAEMMEGDLKGEANTLIKYFLASLAIPEKDLWVNLSPYEKNRIIPETFGITEMGRDLLAQDYILKQLTSSLIYPEEELGYRFWDRVYAKARELYGVQEIPVNTFNKVWVLPEKAVVYEKGTTVFILESHLKVMLEEDYLALKSNVRNENEKTDQEEKLNRISSQLIKEVIIPEIEREVNEGENFAKLRQIYHSLILAKWYKENLKSSILSAEYADQKKIAGVDVADKQIKEKIYNQYLDAFKKGVFNYIKEDYNPISKEIIPVKYFSGGFRFVVPLEARKNPAELAELTPEGKLQWIRGMYVQPRVSARYINNKFGAEIRSEGGEKIAPIEYEGKKTPTYSVDVPLSEVGQLGHIGLGEKEIKEGKVIYKEGGDVVVYLLKEVANNLQVRNHEGLKAHRIREKMKSLGAEQNLSRSLTPQEMREWIKKNVNGLAGEFLREIDQEAERRYPLKALYQEAKEEGRLPSDTFIAQTYLQAEDFSALNFAGGRTTDVEEYFTKDELRSFKEASDEISLIVERIEKLKKGVGNAKSKSDSKERIANLLRPLTRDGKALFSQKTPDVMSKKKDVDQRLGFFLELALMRGDNGTFLFSPSKICRIIKDYDLQQTDEIKMLILDLQGILDEEGHPLLNGMDIGSIVFTSGTPKEKIESIEALQQIRDNETTKQLFSGTNIALILRNKDSLEEKIDLINYLKNIKDKTTGKALFNRTDISVICYSGKTLEDKKKLIKALQRIKNKATGNSLFDGTDIGKIIYSSGTYEEIIAFIIYLRDIKDKKTSKVIFNSKDIVKILYSGEIQSEKKKLIEALQEIRDEETGEVFFSGGNIAKVINSGRGSAQEKTKFIVYLKEMKDNEGNSLFNGNSIGSIFLSGRKDIEKRMLIEALKKIKYQSTETSLFNGIYISRIVASGGTHAEIMQLIEELQEIMDPKTGNSQFNGHDVGSIVWSGRSYKEKMKLILYLKDAQHGKTGKALFQRMDILNIFNSARTYAEILKLVKALKEIQDEVTEESLFDGTDIARIVSIDGTHKEKIDLITYLQNIKDEKTGIQIFDVEDIGRIFLSARMLGEKKVLIEFLRKNKDEKIGESLFERTDIINILNSYRTHDEIVKLVEDLKDFQDKNTGEKLFAGADIRRMIAIKETSAVQIDLVSYLQNVQAEKEVNFLFSKKDILKISLNVRRPKEKKRLIEALRKARHKITRELLFNGSEISSIVCSEGTYKQKIDLLKILQDAKDEITQELLFSGKDISRIMYSAGSNAEKVELIQSLQVFKNQRTKKTLFNGIDIAKIVYKNETNEEKLNFIYKLVIMEDEEEEILFDGTDISTMIYRKGTSSEKMKLIFYLRKRLEEDGKFRFQRRHIVRIIKRMKYFDEKKIQKMEKIFQSAQVNINIMLSWLLYPEEYTSLLESLMNKVFEELTPLEKRRRGALMSFSSSLLDEEHILALAEIYLEETEIIRFANYVQDEISADRIRLITLLQKELDPEARDELLKRLMLSYNRDIRSQTVGQIYKMVGPDILRASQRYGDDGEDVVAESLSRYNWNRLNAGIENLKRNLKIKLIFRKSYLQWLSMPRGFKRIFRAIHRLKKQGLNPKEIVNHLTNEGGYSSHEVSSALNFKELSLDTPVDEKRTLYDFIEGESMDNSQGFDDDYSDQESDDDSQENSDDLDSNPWWGFSGNEVDWKFIEAKSALLKGEVLIANQLISQAIKFLIEVDFEEIDESGYPLADMINQMQVVKWTLRELIRRSVASDDSIALLKLLEEGKNGLELKETLRSEIRGSPESLSSDAARDTPFTSKSKEKERVGGIDFNLDLVEIKTLGEGMDFNLPGAERKNYSIHIDDGLLPIITNMIPLRGIDHLIMLFQ